MTNYLTISIAVQLKGCGQNIAQRAATGTRSTGAFQVKKV